MGLRTGGMLSTENRWRLVAALIFAALTVNASCSQIYTSESAVTAGYFVGSPPFNDPVYLEEYPDLGRVALRMDGFGLDQGGLVTAWGDVWKYGSNWNDALIYMHTARTLTPPPPPYRYRLLVPYLAGLIFRLTGLSIPVIFLSLNVACTLLAALLFFEYLGRFHGFSRLVSLLGGCLFVVSRSVTTTLAYPLIDPVTFLWVVLIFWGVRAKRPVLFIVVSLAGVLTRGVLAIGGVLYLFANYDRRERLAGNVPVILVSLVPIAAYMAVHLALGGTVDEVSSGYHLFRGELPVFAFRLLRWSGWVEILEKLLVAFSFLWAGLWNLRRDRFLRLAFLVVGLPVIAAAVLFSSNIARPVGILYPVMIPLFLIFVQRLLERGSAQIPDGARG
jgi:hypothetical protein